MAIELSTVKSLLDLYDLTTVVQDIEKKIDEKFSDPNWVKMWQQGDQSSPYWTISFPGKIRDAVKSKIEQNYLTAGWERVEIENHVFPDPRENCFSVKLYGNP